MTARGPDVFEVERPRLVGLAYRMLGSMADADDVVQEAWFRWHRASETSETSSPAIERPEAWLTTVVSRIALDRLRSRQRERTAYVGPWLPEPVVIDDRDPGARAEQADDISIGFLHLLERLKPRERVAFVLTDVFREPHQAVSDALGTSVANARQLLHRARAKVSAAPRPNRASANEISDVLDAFGRACAGGDVDALLHLLAPDVVLVSDGGRDHHAARRPVVGPARVARLMMNLARRFPADGTIEVANVNTQPALVVRRRGRPVWLQTFELRDGRIWRMRLIVNPAKLGRLDQPVTLR